jgi:hypothetical protein
MIMAEVVAIGDRKAEELYCKINNPQHFLYDSLPLRRKREFRIAEKRHRVVTVATRLFVEQMLLLKKYVKYILLTY